MTITDPSLEGLDGNSISRIVSNRARNKVLVFLRSKYPDDFSLFKEQELNTGLAPRAAWHKAARRLRSHHWEEADMLQAIAFQQEATRVGYEPAPRGGSRVKKTATTTIEGHTS